MAVTKTSKMAVKGTVLEFRMPREAGHCLEYPHDAGRIFQGTVDKIVLTHCYPIVIRYTKDNRSLCMTLGVSDVVRLVSGWKEVAR